MQRRGTISLPELLDDVLGFISDSVLIEAQMWRGPNVVGSRIQFSRTIGALNAIIRLSSDIDSYRAVSPSRMSEDKTREPEFYSGSYNVADNDAAKSMLCNKTADVFLL
jgi:hypothetical protein